MWWPFTRLLVRRLAVRGASFCGVPFRCVLHFVVLLISGVALHELSSSSREDTPDDCGCPCDLLFCFLLSALWGHVANACLHRKPRHQRISTSHVLRRSSSEMSDASQCVPCPWLGLLIFLADPILPDPHFLLMFPVANNNEVFFQLLYPLAGNRVVFKHNRRDYNVLQWDGCGSLPFRSLAM